MITTTIKPDGDPLDVSEEECASLMRDLVLLLEHPARYRQVDISAQELVFTPEKGLHELRFIVPSFYGLGSGTSRQRTAEFLYDFYSSSETVDHYRQQLDALAHDYYTAEVTAHLTGHYTGRTPNKLAFAGKHPRVPTPDVFDPMKERGKTPSPAM